MARRAVFTASRARHGFHFVRAELGSKEGYGLPLRTVDAVRELVGTCDAGTLTIPHRGGRMTIAWAPSGGIGLFTVEITTAEEPFAPAPPPGHPCERHPGTTGAES